MQSVYKDLNQDDINQVKQYLKQYHDWKTKARQLKPRLGSPEIDGMPKGSRSDPDAAMVNYVNAQYEWKHRDWILNEIREWGDEYDIYADILSMRFVHHHWSVTQVRMKLGLSERTFYDYQYNALCEAAKYIPQK